MRPKRSMDVFGSLEKTQEGQESASAKVRRNQPNPDWLQNTL